MWNLTYCHYLYPSESINEKPSARPGSFPVQALTKFHGLGHTTLNIHFEWSLWDFF